MIQPRNNQFSSKTTLFNKVMHHITNESFLLLNIYWPSRKEDHNTVPCNQQLEQTHCEIIDDHLKSLKVKTSPQQRVKNNLAR